MVEKAGTCDPSDDTQNMENQITILESQVKRAIDEDKPSPRIEAMLWRLFNEIARSHRRIMT